MKRIGFSLLLLLALVVGCKKAPDVADAQPKTVSDVLAETPSFSLLKAAVQQAGLSDALKATNLTLFAPTDDAFKARGFTNPESFKNIPTESLRAIVQYHLINGVVTTKTPELTSASNLPVETASTSSLFLTNGAGGLYANGVLVAKADQATANGVIHTIGSVLIPPAGDALTALKNRNDLSLLVYAINRAATARPELLTILNGTSSTPLTKQVTLFAPNDAAFAAAGYRTQADLNAASPTVLANLLPYHVIPGLTFSNQFLTGALTTLNTTASNKVALTVTGKTITVKGNKNGLPATITAADILSKNAIIHVIDQVLQP